MKRQNQTPEQFGLKVRQAPGALLITAKNKMRSATAVSRPITVSGRMIETPRLKGDKATVAENEALCRSFLKSLATDERIPTVDYDSFTKAYIWKNVPKKLIIELVRNFTTHPWNLNFQPVALADYISNDDGALEFWDVAIPQGSQTENTVPVDLIDRTIDIIPEGRKLEWDASIANLLRVNGHHVRVGTGGCSKIGLAKDRIRQLRKDNERITDRTYLIKDRNPIALIHILKNTTPIENRKEIDPEILFALGLGFPNDGRNRQANYMVNVNELRNWVDITDEDDDDDID